MPPFVPKTIYVCPVVRTPEAPGAILVIAFTVLVVNGFGDIAIDVFSEFVAPEPPDEPPAFPETLAVTCAPPDPPPPPLAKNTLPILLSPPLFPEVLVTIVPPAPTVTL